MFLCYVKHNNNVIGFYGNIEKILHGTLNT